MMKEPGWWLDREGTARTDFTGQGIDFAEEQNKRMYERYGDKSKICPDCKRLCSPQAKRCMGCRVLSRLGGAERRTIFITNDEDFKIRARKRIKELALEQGWSPRAIEQHLGLE
tara:strand:- start:956 stop:1297 length:342 start_codon:yes stop_codon:yes gene_type:complete